MDKMIITVILTILLTGCNIFGGRVVREVQIVEVKVPVLECPAAYSDIPAPVRPALISPLLTKADVAQPGRVVQACAVDSRQLLYYAEQLEAKVQMADSMCSK